MDRVLLEIMCHKVTAIADEICAALLRSSRSVYVNEAADFAVGMLDLKGRIFAWPHESKTTSINVPAAHTLRAVPDLDPGDAIVTNDPYASEGMATHLPDLHLIRPYFHKGRIVAYGWGFIHYMDVGGRVPGSITTSNHDIFQEGLRIPPMKVLRRGKLNEDFVKILKANCRLPEVNMADVKSMLGALEVGARRVADTIAHYGEKTFVDCQEALLDYGEAKARAVLRLLPDGVYEAWDYLDDDHVSRIPIRVRVRMTVNDGRVHFDLTGTDPQVKAAYNIPTAGSMHNMFTRRITTFMRTHDKTLPLNAGIYRPFSIDNPPGTVLNAEYPDAVGVRFATATSFNDAVNGVLLRAAPGHMAGPTCGTGCSIVLNEVDPRTNRPTVIVVQSMRGGMSAYRGSDGVDTRDVTMNTMFNHPIETAEAKSGVRIVEYDIRTDSGGPGRWRGGAGQVMTVEVTRDGSTIQVRGTDRFRFPPWGVQGGKPGAAMRVILNRGKSDERVFGKMDPIAVRKGDTITVMMPGAAGFGDPFERDPEAVLRDVRFGYVSIAAARVEYGVVIDGRRIDHAATAKLRAGRVRANLRTDFDYGPEREAWERVFDDQTVCALNRRLMVLPKAARSEKRRRIFEEAVPDLPPAGLGSLTEVLKDADAVRARLAQAIDRVLGAASRAAE